MESGKGNFFLSTYVFLFFSFLFFSFLLREGEVHVPHVLSINQLGRPVSQSVRWTGRQACRELRKRNTTTTRREKVFG